MVITLIGMPGAGKSCMGRSLSGKLHMHLIDGDKLIEQRYQKKLHQIIEESGLDGFKEIERTTLMSIDDDDVIITPGGSAVYYDEFMQKSKERGIVVYLYCSPETILARIGDFSKRGIVLKEGFTIHDLYNERAPLFEKYADLTINCDGESYSKYRHVLLNEVNKYIRRMEKSKKQGT